MNDRVHSLSPSTKPGPTESRWNIAVGRLAGIDVYVHGSLLILLAILAVAQLVILGSPFAAVLGAASLGIVFLCVLLHELGHALAARRYGIGTKRITLLPIGGVAQLERMPRRPSAELWVALAGPAVNLVLAALALGGLTVVSSMGLAVGWIRAFEFLLSVNLLLFLFNLVPAFPMDGGRVLRALLSMRLGEVRATEVAARVGRFLAVGIGLLGLAVNPILVFIAIFVWFGAGQEAAMVRARAALGDAYVGQAMATEFRTLAPTDSLREAAELVVRTAQRHYPVVEDGRVVGLLQQNDLFAAVARDDSQPVGAVMRRDFETAGPAESLEAVFTRFLAGPLAALPVVDGSRLVGWLTREHLSEFMELRRACLQPAPAT